MGMRHTHTVVPNGIITGLDIGFSNKSLVYITMSFYTMCKSTVPIFLLACAFIWRIERRVPLKHVVQSLPCPAWPAAHVVPCRALQHPPPLFSTSPSAGPAGSWLAW